MKNNFISELTIIKFFAILSLSQQSNHTIMNHIKHYANARKFILNSVFSREEILNFRRESPGFFIFGLDNVSVKISPFLKTIEVLNYETNEAAFLTGNAHLHIINLIEQHLSKFIDTVVNKVNYHDLLVQYWHEDITSERSRV